MKLFFEMRKFIFFAIVFSICPSLLQADEAKGSGTEFSSKQSRKLVLFVHGYTGDPYKTWTSTDSKTTWLKLIDEDNDLKGIGFYSDPYGYETSEISKNAPRINVLSRDLLDHLKKISRIEKNVEQIYIVAHSLGGIIAMDALARAHRKREHDRECRKVFETVKAIFLIATPLEGVAIHDVVKYICTNKQILDTEEDRPYNEIVNSSWLDIMKDSTEEPRPYIYTSYETEETEVKKFGFRVNRLLVPSNSLSPNRDEDPYEVTGKDHINIVKPISSTDRAYIWVKDRLIKTTIGLEFDDLKRAEGLDRWLNGIKIEHLRKYVESENLRELQYLLKTFSKGIRERNHAVLRDTVKHILHIMPTDPFFRVHNILLNGRMFGDIFEGRFRVVQVVRWDWIVEGDEKPELLITTAKDNLERVTYGPFTNNIISMLDAPIQKFIQLRFQSHGTGRVSWYQSTFRVGWSIAEKKEDGTWAPMIAFAEYDPYFRIGLSGGLED